MPQAARRAASCRAGHLRVCFDYVAAMLACRSLLRGEQHAAALFPIDDAEAGFITPPLPAFYLAGTARPWHQARWSPVLSRLRERERPTPLKPGKRPR